MDFTKTWYQAKDYWDNHEFKKAIELFKELDLFIEANQDVSKDKHFYHALVLGDYLGVLCESGLFKDAVEISIKAIQYKEKWNFRSLLFISIRQIFICLAMIIKPP